MDKVPRVSRQLNVVLTAALYFASVFGFAFVMGVARVLVVAPRLGQTIAVVVEVPIVLLVSWVVARQLLQDRRFGLADRVAVGSIALALTMASEAVLASLLRGQSAIQWATAIVTPLGLVGLLGQLGFASMPVIVGYVRTGAKAC